jgi:hypothetical protein
MGSRIRYWTERTALAAVAAAGILVPVAELAGLIDELSPATLAKLTLVILSTVTLFLLLEIDRLGVLDKVWELLRPLDLDGEASRFRQERYGGIVRVHDHFPEETFTAFLEDARREVTILQTWVPNLHRFTWALKKAIVDRQVQVNVLLLHPMSPVAQLREEALRRDPARRERVRDNVSECLCILAELSQELEGRDRARLRVRVYNSLPSIAVYKADDHCLVSSFLHGQLAIDSSQTEIDGDDTTMGRGVQRELDELWRIGRDVDLDDWRGSTDTL